MRPRVEPINIPPRHETVGNVEESVETASETFQAVANRMKEAQEMEAQLKMEVEEAEALAREETQKYANKLQALFKKNEILRQKKLRSLETARAAKERYMREKAAFDAAESDEGMSTPIEPNAVDNAIDEVQAGKDIEV